VDTGEEYAVLLAAANRQTAAGEFRRWLASAKAESSRELQIALAGLSLLAGDAGPAKEREAELLGNLSQVSVPEELAALGWWAYKAGDYASAFTMLSAAAEKRPANSHIQLQLAWTEIALSQYASALQSIDNAYADDELRREQSMAWAVARWQAMDQEKALEDFEQVARVKPEWSNQRWVAALYASSVWQSIDAMQAELERRKKTAKEIRQR
jgi:tetratricopeptide (TPR) repeat protein